MEAERIRQEEESRLRKKMNEKKAKEEADRLLQMRLADIDKEVEEEVARQREEALLKREQIDIAEKRRNEPVSDQKLVCCGTVHCHFFTLCKFSKSFLNWK